MVRISSGHARAGRNFYENMSEGTIISKTSKRKIEYIVKGNEIVEKNEINGKRKIRIVYGDKETIYKNGKIVETTNFRPGSNCARIFKGVWKTRKEMLDGKYPIISKTKCYGGGFRNEEVRYLPSKKLAYKCYYGKKHLELNYPNGKLWMSLDGLGESKISFAYKTSILLDRRYRWHDKEDSIIMPKNYDYSTLFTGGDYKVLVLDIEGKLQVQGEVKNRQKIDKWIEDYKEVYYLVGVPVSKKLYFAKPDELDPMEVIRVPNVQLRASLLSKIGLNKVVEKLKGTVIDKDETHGYELVSIKVDRQNIKDWQGDDELKFIKLVCPSTKNIYIERVNPRAITCEQARQMNFGVRNATPDNKENEWLNLVEET